MTRARVFVTGGSGLLGSIARYAIIVYAVFAALTQLNIAIELTAPTFLILLGAVALAAAIAFGIGGREVAQDIIQRIFRTNAIEVFRLEEKLGISGESYKDPNESGVRL